MESSSRVITVPPNRSREHLGSKKLPEPEAPPVIRRLLVGHCLWPSRLALTSHHRAQPEISPNILPPPAGPRNIIIIIKHPPLKPKTPIPLAFRRPIRWGIRWHKDTNAGRVRFSGRLASRRLPASRLASWRLASTPCLALHLINGKSFFEPHLICVLD